MTIRFKKGDLVRIKGTNAKGIVLSYDSVSKDLNVYWTYLGSTSKFHLSEFFSQWFEVISENNENV